MLVLFILAAFASTFLVLRISLKDHDWREWFLITSIIMGALVALLTEILGVLRVLNQGALAAFWGLYLLGIVLGIGWRRYKDHHPPRQSDNQTLETYSTRSIQKKFPRWIKKPENLALLVIAFSVIILLTIAWLAPPNTNDSLHYHMSRMMNWAQHGDLEHYVTPIDRQLWMPPWTEYAILNLFLLSSSDSLSNLIQWFAMLGSLVGVSLIARMLGASRSGQIFASLFCLTIRMGVLQSSSTQTDYATAFWAICLACLTLYVNKNGLFRFNNSTASRKWFLPVLLCLTTGLGILTKGTFVAFALPLLLWMLVSILHHHRWTRAFQLFLLGLGVVFLLNVGVWWRNFQTYQSPLGPRIGMYLNERFTTGVLISNLIRNSTLHLGTPYGIVNGPLRESAEWIHNLIGLDANDPQTTIDTYRIKRSLHEDYAGNNLHFFSIPLSLILLSSPIQSAIRQVVHRKKIQLQVNTAHVDVPSASSSETKSSVLTSYVLAILISFAVFSLLFKWQATGSRLQLPFFVLWSPVAGAAYDRIRVSWGNYFLVGLFLLNALPSLISNPSRPLVHTDSTPSVFNARRTELLFVNSPEFMPGYLSIIDRVQNTGCQQVGLEIDSSHPDYPFWALLSPTTKETQIVYYTDNPELEKYRGWGFNPCAVICTICTGHEWDGLKLDSTHFGGYFLYLEER
jgi:4-amino-4-deoxy-L-arabinose transferase-like glycosyltransferase